MELKEYLKKVIDEFDEVEVVCKCELDVGIDIDMTVNPDSKNRLKINVVNQI